MNIPTKPLLLFMLSAHAVSSVAADGVDNTSSGPDTQQWKCKYCAFPAGLRGTVDFGLGYASNDAFKFGEYNGINQHSGFLIGDAELTYFGEEAKYWTMNATDLGLDSRALNVEGGKQGAFKVTFGYKELPHFIDAAVATPFVNGGSNALTLPTSWVTGTATSTMPALDTDLQSTSVKTKRKQLQASASITPASAWQYSIAFHHETKQGTQATAGAFFFNSTQLIRPVDYVTDQLDAAAAYTGNKLQLRVTYSASAFRNHNASLTWQNPYTALLNADAGQLALPPDNQFHELQLALGYQISNDTRVTADIAMGRMTQDQEFLAPTLNATLNAVAPPRKSLAGKVDTRNANLKFASAVTQLLRVNATYIYNDRDNQTPQAAYAWVSTDSFVNTPTVNLPYSFTQSTWKLRADYRLLKYLHAAAGYDNDSRKRTFQETEHTRERSVWGKIDLQNWHSMDVSLKVVHGKRDQSGYAPLTATGVIENPLLIKYNMANRFRDSAELRVDTAIGDKLTLGAGINVARDEYPDSKLGLIYGKDISYNADVTLLLTHTTSTHLFASREEIQSRQMGSSNFSVADWTGHNDDTINYFGIGIKRSKLMEKLDVGADYTVTNSHGAVMVDTGTLAAPFPDLVSKRDTLKLYGTYRLADKISLQAAYWYEQYHSDNWMLAGVAPGTISNVLTLGQLAPIYHVNVISLSGRYQFK